MKIELGKRQIDHTCIYVCRQAGRAEGSSAVVVEVFKLPVPVDDASLGLENLELLSLLQLEKSCFQGQDTMASS